MSDRCIIHVHVYMYSMRQRTCRSKYHAYKLRARACELLLKIMAVLAKVGMLCKQLPRPMPLLLLYRAPSFGCSSFFVYSGLCKNRSTCMGVCNVINVFTYMDRSYSPF